MSILFEFLDLRFLQSKNVNSTFFSRKFAMTRLLKTFELCSRHLLMKKKNPRHVYTTLVTFTCLTVASSIVRAWMRRSSFVLLLNNIPIFCRAPVNCTDQNTSKKSGSTMMQRKTLNKCIHRS